MVPHVLLMAKLSIIQLFQLSPLLWPLNLYLPLLRQLPKVCTTISSASALFAFRLRQIVTVERRQGQTRLERVFRLICEQLLQWRLHPRYNSAVDESTLHALLLLSY